MPQGWLFRIFLLTVMLSYLLVFSEWLFFVTKPSFLSNWTLLERIGLLFLVPLPAVAIALVILAVFGSINSLAAGSWFTKCLPLVFLSVPVALLAVMVLMLVENFTHTVFGFNVGNFAGPIRYIYLMAFVVFVLVSARGLYAVVKSPDRSFVDYPVKPIVLGLVLVSGVTLLIKLVMVEDISRDDSRASTQSLPNILILSTDGLNASSMSAYGYHRDTTPFINKLAPHSLFVENRFTNNAKSTGSIGALFSGKLPTKTRVIYPPDIFRGIHSFQHMPGLLRKLGYRSADFSIRHYTDPYDLNMRDGFDQANGREVGVIADSLEVPFFEKRTFMNESYFFEQVFSRLWMRVQHVWSIRDMINPYAEVTNLEDAKRHFPDARRIKQLFEFINESTNPFFAHVHLMVTHGSKFRPERRVFSEGMEQQEQWMTDFYDDAVLNYDDIVREVVTQLEQRDLLEETLLVITSDHGSRWVATERTPLILRFPNRQHAGVRHNNVQHIDLTATIVDYLGVQIPDWMQGQSFLHGEVDPDRPIFFTDSITWGAMDSGGWRDVSSYEPPYYSLGGVGVIVGQRWHYLNLTRNRMTAGSIRDHSTPLAGKDLPSTDEASRMIGGHLQENDYPLPGFSENKQPKGKTP